MTAAVKTKVYGATDPALTYTITSGALQGSDAFTGSLTRGAGEAVGTHAINQGTLALSSNYTLTYVGANLTVTTAPLTVTSVDASKLFGGTDPAFTYTRSALTNSDTDSVFSGSLARTAGESVGTTTINIGTLSAGSNYAVTFVPGVFTINVNPASTVESIATSTNPDMTVSGTITNASQTSGHGVGLTVVVDIPADITVTGTSTWDGTFTLPTVTTNAFIVGTAGTVITSIEAIEIGAGDTPLSLDKAVKLTFAGKAGTLVGWSQAGSFHSITNTCDSATAPTLGADADCKIDVGNDLIIWTKHFSIFISYKEVSDHIGSTGGGGGGGGGIVSGAGSVGYQNTPSVSTSGSTGGGAVLGAKTYNFTKNLSLGMSGNDVTELQKLLTAQGFYKGPITGYFGKLTLVAVKAFQKAHNIAQVGSVGPLTRAALNAN
ncbi:MAG: MBG domain-containing protein [Candidatus Adlerbacteria bacterium]|nr:MBG domain-containing protein [Candidatus Adlerbacteria bacterium]